MTLFTYDDTVPAANDDPSDDQPVILSNVEQSALIWEVDHVGFNAASGGTHLQTTFSSKNAAGAQTDPQSVLYTGDGTASSVADLFFKNQNATFRPNAIKAAGRIQCRSGAGPDTVITGFNVVSASQAAAGTNWAVSVTLTSNAVVGSPAIAIPLANLEVATLTSSFLTNGGFISSTSISGNVLTFVITRVNGLGTDVFINFAVLQV